MIGRNKFLHALPAVCVTENGSPSGGPFSLAVIAPELYLAGKRLYNMDRQDRKTGRIGK